MTTSGPPHPGLLVAYDALVREADAQFRDLDARLQDEDAVDALALALTARRQATTELIDLLESAVALCLERSLGGPGRG